MSFNIDNFGADASNIKSILGGANYYRYFNKDNNTLTTPGYFPADLGLAVGDRIKVIPSVKTNPDELYVVTSIANRTVTVTQIDTDGAVDSVNGKTGNVVLDASDVGALASTVKAADIDGVAQLSTMPTASADNLGDIVQFIGTTDATYTNGYFYKCVSDEQEQPTYSWTQVSVQPAPSGLPDQTGQSGKFLTTDGTDASWGDVLFPMPDQYTRSTQDPTLAVGSPVRGFGMVSTSVSGWRGNKGGFKINKSNSNEYGCRIEILDGNGTPSNFSFESNVGFYVYGELSTVKNLGTSTYKWTKAYITQLNNGANIDVPTTGGTMVVATPPTTPNTTWTLKATVDANGDYTVAWVQDV